MLVWLFAILLIASFLYFLFYKNYGYILSFLFIYPVFLSYLLKQFGIKGFAIFTRYSIILILLIISYKYWKHNIIKIKYSIIVISLLLLTTSLLYFNIISPNINNPLVLSFQRNYFLYTIVPFCVVALLILDKNTLFEFIASIQYWGALYIIFFLVNYDTNKINTLNRMSFVDITGVSTIAASGIFGLSIIVLSTQILNKAITRIALIILLLINIICVLAVGQRGTVIGIVIGLSIYILFAKVKKKAIIIMILIIIVLFQVINIRQYEIYERMVDLKNYRKYPRYADYSVSMEIFKNNSFLKGEGSLGYMFITGRSYPHNIILECMVDYGLPGLLAIIAIIINGIYYCYLIYKDKKAAYQYKIVATTWIMLLVSALVSSNLVSNSVLIIFTGVLLASNKIINSDKNKPVEIQ